MKSQLLVMLLVLAAVAEVQAQSKVGSNPTTLDASAAFEIESTNKGFLPPRMTTTQRNAISSPATGLVIFNTTTGTLQTNTGTPAAAVWSTINAPVAAYSSGDTIGLYQTNAFTGTGNNSNFFGYLAGNGTTNNNSNYLGRLAGGSATGANFSNFFGNGAGLNAPFAQRSNFLGEFAGSSADSAELSNFIGMYAGQGASKSQRSNMIGGYAGQGASRAPYCNIIGYGAGQYAANVMHANFVGNHAGLEGDSASYSNFIGYYAGASFAGNKVGANNIIIGTGISLPNATANAMNLGGVLYGTGLNYDTLYPPTITPVTGGKIGIGVVSPAQTLQVKGDLGLTNGTYYTAFTQGTQTANISYTLPAAAATASGQVLTNNGSGALSWSNIPTGAVSTYSSGATIGLYQTNASTGTGDNSIFLGNSAGNGTTNDNCNYLGKQVGFGATGANFSNFLGAFAGMSASLAHGSNFFGEHAGSSAANSELSNFLGNYAGQGAPNSARSNMIGGYAGQGASGSSYSNIIGYGAGQYAANVTHANFIGDHAGNDADSASYSNFIGYYAGQSFTGNKVGANNIIIGTNISLPNATANAMNLGGVLYGTGLYSNTAGVPSITPVAGGKIGIGVVSPAQTLQVKGDLGLTNGTYYTAFTQGTQTANISYTLPAAAATASGQVLTNNGSGTLTWSYAGTAAIASKTSNYTLTASDNTIVSSNSATMTLPAASGFTGKQFRIVSGGGTSTVSGSLVLSGASQATYSLDATNGSRGITVQSDGTNWIIIDRF
jgi:hypothetical protein